MAYKSGYVAIAGKPNVGKSTILNYLLETNLSIVTSKPETTRDKITGTLTLNQGQINFIDTPGMHIPHTLLGRHMVRQAKEALEEADVILAVLDAKKRLDKSDKAMFDAISQSAKPTILLINKVDVADKRPILTLIDECSKMGIFKDYIPMSARKGDNMGLLIPKILELLPDGPKYFPDDYLTDKTERFLSAEIIREQVLNLTEEEIPYCTAVEVEEMKKIPKKDVYNIKALIYIERESQKAIIIGKKGQMLKSIGTTARLKIEKMLDKRVYLELRVKVYENWRKDPQALKMFGYA